MMTLQKFNPGFLRRSVKQLLFMIAVYAVMASLMATGIIGDYPGYILTTASILVIAGLGLSLITGMTGQLVLCQGAFMGLGAYTTAVLVKSATTLFPGGVPILLALAAGALLSALVGLLFGALALRLSGDYFAIVTLGFGEIVVALLKNLDKITGGASGLFQIPKNIRLDIDNMNIVTTVQFLFVGLFMVISILMVVHLLTSSHGRAILSVRENEIAAEAMGIKIFYTKLYAFAFCALLGGLAGGLWAGHYGYLNPDSFTWLKSIDILIIVVLGGLGSFTGTFAAAFAVTILNELLKFLPSIGGFELKDMRLVIYPLLLILMMIFRPQGLLGTKELLLTDTLLSGKWWAKLFGAPVKGGDAK